MKHKVSEYIRLFISLTFFLALLFVIGRAGALELDYITVGQALISGAFGLGYMAVSVIIYKKIEEGVN